MKQTIVGVAWATLVCCGCASPGPTGPDVATAQERLTLRTSEALQLAAILGYELSSLPTDPPSITGGVGMGEDEPTPGPSGSEPVASGDCTEVTWEPTDPFALTLVFDGCPLDSGDAVYGSVAVTLARDGRGSVAVRFDNLAVGERLLSGDMSLGVLGVGVRVDADLTYLDADTVMGIELEAVSLEVRPDGVHLNGTGAIDEGADRWRATFNDVTWTLASLCHPSAGSVDLERPSEPPVTLMFSADRVTVQRGAEPPMELPLGC